MPRSVLGLDIGGANFKAAHSSGAAALQPFALWKNPAGLPAALGELARRLPPFDLLAVTMTGELCDCFENKKQGVRTILKAVQTVAGSVPVRVWQVNGKFVDPAAARKAPLKAASANWLALATFAGRFAGKGLSLLIDIGSTTTDIVPLHDGKPKPRFLTDPERLVSGELVYTGVRRTPLCALLGFNAAAELFATTLDIYLVLGRIPEDPADLNTADGRPATRAAAHARLARMRCADPITCSLAEMHLLAEMTYQRQLTGIIQRLMTVESYLPSRPQSFIVSGSGEFLALDVVNTLHTVPVILLSERLGPRTSEAACAYAVAKLAEEE